MDDATARTLAAINRAFYAERAAEFSATREGPWPGWQLLWRRLAAEGLDADLEVLDLGCGNGRLGRFLAERSPGLRYLGLDASPPLLEIAAAAGGLGKAPELRAFDLLEDDLAEALGERRFTFVAVFGVLHHLPGRARRRALLEALLARLRDRGILAVTSWRLAQFERFTGRDLSWEAYNRDAERPVDPTQLEPGDRLLPWKGGEGVRYVHFAHENETRELLEGLGVELVETFDSDGREQALNRYFLVRPGA